MDYIVGKIQHTDYPLVAHMLSLLHDDFRVQKLLLNLNINKITETGIPIT